MSRHLDGVTYEADPPFEMDGFIVRRCMRSGLCCTTTTCGEGLKHGAEPKGCKFLRGGKPGEYRCGLVEDDPEQASVIGVGWGCCMPLFNTERILLVLRESRSKS